MASNGTNREHGLPWGQAILRPASPSQWHELTKPRGFCLFVCFLFLKRLIQFYEVRLNFLIPKEGSFGWDPRVISPSPAFFRAPGALQMQPFLLQSQSSLCLQSFLSLDHSWVWK